MGTEQEAIDHRRLAAALFNRTWELLSQETRSQDDDAEMLTAAFASRYHWLQVGEPSNFTISDWQVSRVAAVLGHGRLAADFAGSSLAIASEADLGAFYVGYAHEAAARAARVLGDDAGVQEHLDIALGLLDQVDDTSDRELLAADLEELRS